MAAAQAERRAELLRAEITRLETEIGVLERQWNKKHWLALFGLVAIPLMIAGVSPLWVAITIIATPCLVATQAYLLYMRRAECRELISQAKIDLDFVQRGGPPPGARRSRA